MAVDIKQYTEELLKTAGVSDDTVKQAVMGFFSNDTVAKRLSDDILRQQDYSRSMDALAKEKKSTSDYYQSLVNWKAEQEALLAGATRVEPTVATGDFLTKAELKKFQEDLAKENQQRESNFIAITKKVGRLASRHANTFHEELDTDALEKIVVEQKVDLDRAYELMVADRKAAMEKEAFDARIKREREEAVREFASTRQIPIDSTPSETGVYGRLNLTPDKNTVAEHVPHEGRLTAAGHKQLQNAFVEEWTKAAGGASSQ